MHLLRKIKSTAPEKKKIQIRVLSTLKERVIHPALVQEEGIEYWQEMILKIITFSGIILGLLVFIPSIVHIVQRAWWGVLISSSIIYLLTVVVVVKHPVSFRWQVILVIFISYFLGTLSLITMGPNGAGFLWLFAFMVLSSSLLGLVPAIISVGVNALTLFILGVLLGTGSLSDTALSEYSGWNWAIVSANFLALNILVSVSISILMRGLDITLAREREARKSLKDEQEQLIDTNVRLKQEMVDKVSALDALEESEERYRRLVELSPEAILVQDGREIIYINQAGCDLLGVEKPEDITGLPVRQILHMEDYEIISEQLEDNQNVKKRWNAVEVKLTRSDGKVLTTEMSSAGITYAGKEAYLVIIRDVTDRKLTEERLMHMATHDTLTNLPNRFLFHDRLSQALGRAKRNGNRVAVLFLDIDNFKEVNEAFGHLSGDLLLQILAKRLQSSLRATDTVARMGGDEFAILLDDIKRSQDVGPIALKILDRISEAFSMENKEMFVTASIGISIYPENGIIPQTLLRNADIAMFRTKEGGKNNYQFYSGDMIVKAHEGLSLRNQLRKAFEHGEFDLHYQPQVDLISGDIIGLEALLRWQRPQGDVPIPPSHFVSIMEEMGLIHSVGEWVMRAACEQNRLWQKAGLRPMRVAVNVSGKQLEKKNLVDVVSRVLRGANMHPDFLELELTENSVFRDAELALETLTELRDMGVHLSIDDFGTGYSSLSYLARFPFETLKVDLSFVQRVPDDPGAVEIVKGIIAIAKSLGLKMVVEGVSSRDQIGFFQSQGCNYFQGFYFCEAVPSTEVTFLLQRGLHERIDKLNENKALAREEGRKIPREEIN
jgi:diguanylate cyclase (GGDEF)-like protein/PAS domain S-box-containing protein